MTRKQALQKAIEIIKSTGGTNKEYQEICNTLSSISKELPMARWTKESIIDTYRQFYIDHDRLPTRKDTIYERNVPVVKHIKEKFGMNLTQFYETYCSDLLHDKTNGIVQDFVKQYNEMNYPTREEYEKNKRPGSAGVNKLLSITGSNTWLELLEKCSLQSSLQHRTQFDLKLHITRPDYKCDDDKKARYDEIANAMKKIASDHDKRIARERRYLEMQQHN